MEVDKQRIAGLVEKVQSGDNSAFEELYALTSERAYFVALEFTKNNQDAEDILQESYVKALSKIKELDKPESFSSWLNQIVANKSKDFLKKKKPMLFEAEENEVFEVLPDEDTSFSPEENLDQTELQKTVMEVLDELSEEKRACVLMMYFEELSVGEIAETLEIPEGTVKTRLFSARKDLKEKFAKRGITSLYSAAPVGVVIWALRRMSDAVSKTFVGSGTSAKVLAGISVAGTGTAAGVAAAGTTAATGTGIAAKIAALTVAQKVIAGVSVAAVVTGSAVGVVTVVDERREKETTTTTEFVEEVTTAPSFESTTLLDVMAEITESTQTEPSETERIPAETETSRKETQTTQKAEISAETTQSETKTTGQTELETTTKAKTTRKTTTRRDYSLYTSATTTSTTALSTTVEETTTKRTTTTEAETTTKPTTTVKETTTAKVPEIGYTTPVSEGTGIAVVKISIINLDNTVEKIINYTVPEGTVMTEDYLYSLCESAGYYPDFGFDGDAVGKTAQAGETYTVDAKL